MKKINILFEAFRLNQKVRVTRDCFEQKEVCIGYISSITKIIRKSGNISLDNNEGEICFSMEYRGDEYPKGELLSLSPWLSQVTIEAVKEQS